MQKNFSFYKNLFFTTLQLSAFTFGGGFVIVSLMRKKFVEELHWITEQEMLDFTAIAQSSPGAIAVNASILVGYKVGGWLGAFIAILGTILPPLILLTAISFVYTWFITIDAIRYIMQGMQAGVAAVICDVVCGLSASVWKESRGIALITALLSFILVAFLSVNVILIVVVCIVMGILIYGKERARHGNTP